MCVSMYVCIYLVWHMFIFPKQCLHLGVLTSALTNWPWAWPPSRCQATPMAYSYGKCCKKHSCHNAQVFSGKYCKKHRLRFTRFLAIWAQEKENHRFFIMFSKILQKPRFYMFFEHHGCKNKGQPMFFSMFSAKCCQKHSIAKIAQ